MTHTLITAPSTEPVTIAEARAHLRLDTSGSPPSHPDDALVTALITAARQHIESVTGRALITQTWELRADQFIDGYELPKAPAASITSVTYIDLAGATQTLSSTQYELIADAGPNAQPGRLIPTYLAIWPSSRGHVDDVRIRYVAGYGNGAAVPAPLKAALLLLVAHLHENREASAPAALAQLPFGVQALLAPHQVFS